MLIYTKLGGGIMNAFINKLPWELHIPGYKFCGPNTKLTERIRRGDKPINRLDDSCREHDLKYAQYKDLHNRHKADLELEHRAWERVKSKDATLGEKSAAWFVTNIMKGKRKLGMGLKKRKKKTTFNKILKNIKTSLKGKKISDIYRASNLALLSANKAVNNAGGKSNVSVPRVLPLPKSGGFLPLIPLFAALSALGGLSGGAAAIAKSINDAKAAKKALEENQRHNQTMEAIALGKKGSGYFLKPYRKGMGIFLKHKQKKSKKRI